MYTTTKIEAAEDYALGYTSTNAFYDEGYQGNCIPSASGHVPYLTLAIVETTARPMTPSDRAMT